LVREHKLQDHHEDWQEVEPDDHVSGPEDEDIDHPKEQVLPVSVLFAHGNVIIHASELFLRPDIILELLDLLRTGIGIFTFYSLKFVEECLILVSRLILYV
jgi:hypothetical protein